MVDKIPASDRQTPPHYAFMVLDMCHILSHLALKNYFLAVLEKSLSWVMVVTLILESLLCQAQFVVAGFLVTSEI